MAPCSQPVAPTLNWKFCFRARSFLNPIGSFGGSYVGLRYKKTL